jgi:hypothetical protein
MGEDSGRARGVSLSRRAVAGAALALALPSVGWAQAAGDPPATQDILAVREKVRAAILKKDRATLEALYAENYNHLRDSGRQEVKSDRIALVLSGEPTIETAPEEEVSVQVYGTGTAAVTGVSSIPDPATKRTARFRWVVVYAKDAGAWKVALSQASRVPARR